MQPISGRVANSEPSLGIDSFYSTSSDFGFGLGFGFGFGFGLGLGLGLEKVEQQEWSNWFEMQTRAAPKFLVVGHGFSRHRRHWG